MSIRVEWIRTVAPEKEPLTLAEAKKHAVIHQDDDNALLKSYLAAARGDAEQYLHRALFTQTWKVELSDWVDELRLPMAAPLQSVSSVQYYNASGTLTTLASSYYLVDATASPGRLLRAPNQVWPTLQSDRLMRVVVTYVCGWSDVDVIPEEIKQGIRLRLASMDADRLGAEADVSLKAAQALWAPARVYWSPPCAS